MTQEGVRVIFQWETRQLAIAPLALSGDIKGFRRGWWETGNLLC